MLDKNDLLKNQPGKVKGFGHPWHGLVRSGTLTAADSTTRAYNQPSGGDTNLVRIPGAPGAAGLTAKPGQDWAGYAILSGSSRQLYETTLGSGKWIYADPAGAPWLVTLQEEGQTHDITGAMTANLTLARFGVFGAVPETHAITATLNDLGQGSAPYEVDASFGAQVITSARLDADSINTTGSQTIIALRVYISLSFKPTVGFLLLSITGTPGVDLAANLSVLRSRAQTLGSDAASPPIEAQNYRPEITYTEVEEIVGGPPNCTGYRRVTRTQDPTVFTPIQPEDWVAGDTIAGTGVETWGTTGRIIALAFDAAGAIHEWTVDNTSTLSQTIPLPTDDTTGSIIDTFNFTGSGDSWSPSGCGERKAIVDNTLRQGYSRTSEQTFTATYQIKLDGAVIGGYSVTAKEVCYGTTGWSSGPGEYVNNSDEWHSTYTVSVVGPGGVGHTTTGYSEGYVTWVFCPSLLGGMYQNNSGIALDAEYFNLDLIALRPGNYENVGAQPRYYSNNLIGMAADQDYRQTGPSRYAAGAGSPGYVNTAIMPGEPYFTQYGSWNPVTGEVVWAQPDPVCWV